MNRSEFIKYCINQEMEKAKNEAAANAKLNDFERLMQTLVDINSTAIGTKQAAIRGLLQIQRAMLELYPDNKEIEKIFYGEKTRFTPTCVGNMLISHFMASLETVHPHCVGNILNCFKSPLTGDKWRLRMFGIWQIADIKSFAQWG